MTTGLSLTSSLYSDKPHLLVMILSILSLQLPPRMNVLQCPVFAFQSAKPHLLFMTPPCLQTQYHQGGSYTLPSTATA